ncbi:hypothetical protein BH10PSE3_BH10PSE3_04520 [soil metagenome]
MHARLWLLIALARVALDWPVKIAPHLAMLERVAFSDDFPHVVMRAFAIDALRSVVPVLAPAVGQALLASLEVANRSPFPYESGHGFSGGRYVPRPADAPRPEEAFHLDYDFTKYQIEGLCHVFGCAGWEVEDSITRWVRLWDKDAIGMYDGPRGPGHDEGSWSSGSVPEVDRYGSYLGWHALMLTAGEMLRTRVVTGNAWGGDAWAHFLAEYRLSRADGLWLSDATELFPLDLPKEQDVPMPEVTSEESDREDQTLLMPLLGFRDGALAGASMPIDGRWSLSSDTDVMMSTALAPREEARAVMLTVLTEPKNFRRLPDDDDEIARQFGRTGHSIRPWIDMVKHSERQFDNHDPYATKTALQRSAPAQWVRDLLGLEAEDGIGRSWIDSDGTTFRAEAWGTAGGRGEHSWEESGERISIDRARLLHLLDVSDRLLVGSLKIQTYHRGRKTDYSGKTTPFTYRSLVFTLDRNGRVETLLRPNKLARDAVSSLPARSHHEFRDRFAAILAVVRKPTTR